MLSETGTSGMRTLGLALFFILSFVSHGVCMTDAARRDFLTFCMASGTFQFEDPDLRDSISGAVARGGLRSIEIESLLRLFPDRDRIRVFEQIQKCTGEIAALDTY